MANSDYKAAPWQRTFLLAKPFALMAAYVAAANLGSWWWIAALLVIPFLSSTMSVVMHDVGHGLVGGRARHWWLFVLGASQMLSGHAFWATHSQHHRRYPAAAKVDPEGAPCVKSFTEMVRMMPTFAPLLWFWAWRNKPVVRCWLGVEASASAGLILLGSILWLEYSRPLLLIYCLSTMGTGWVGYTLVAWLSHQRHLLNGPRQQAFAGTFVGSMVAYFFGVIVFHAEHHTCESVPSCNLARFANNNPSIAIDVI